MAIRLHERINELVRILLLFCSEEFRRLTISVNVEYKYFMKIKFYYSAVLGILLDYCSPVSVWCGFDCLFIRRYFLLLFLFSTLLYSPLSLYSPSCRRCYFFPFFCAFYFLVDICVVLFYLIIYLLRCCSQLCCARVIQSLAQTLARYVIYENVSCVALNGSTLSHLLQTKLWMGR